MIIAIALLMIYILSIPFAAAFCEELAQIETVLSPTTGLPTDQPYRPMLVMIANSLEPGRPAWNLSEADIVYESIIWGPMHTRYCAIYNDSHPEKVGGIRSARYYHEIIRAEWDCPFVAYGTSSEFSSNNMEPIGAKVPYSFLISGIRTNLSGIAFSRDPSRPSPHNAVVNLAWILDNKWPEDPESADQPYAPRAPLFQFSQTPSRGEESANTIEIHFEGISKNKPNYLAAYAYNPKKQAYDRSYCGYAQMDGDSGERIIANNVIIQFCETAYYEDDISRPVINLTGEGSMDAYIDGTRIQGSWKRDSVDGQTQFYDADGEVLKLQPGKTFIQIIPTSFGCSYDQDESLCRYVPGIV